MAIITVESRTEPPRWTDCQGTFETTEFKVFVDGRTFIDWYEFDNKQTAIDTAKWCLANEGGKA